MKKLTTEDFIKNAVAVHGDMYDYSVCVYVSSKKPVKIICRKHGVFQQTPNNHLRSGGCNACGYIKSGQKLKKPLWEFIEQANLVHGNKFDYSFVDYSDMFTKVKIKCIHHGVFLQSPQLHMRAAGCPVCYDPSEAGRARRLGFEGFLTKAREVHDCTYDYVPFEYESYNSKAVIVCKQHGYFEQTVADHLAGCGCRLCNGKSFSKVKKSYLYVLRSDEFFKIGITNNIKSRLSKLKNKTPFTFEKVLIIERSGHEVWKLEKKLHKLFKNARLKGFDGCTEWFVRTPDYLDTIYENI